MSKGVVLFAFNNKAINYVEQAEFCAKKIIKHLQLPVTIVTSDKVTNKDLFDKIIVIPKEENQTRNFYDGDQRQKAFWNNKSRTTAYDLSPYHETLVMDTDFIVENDLLLKVFGKGHDFLINHEAQHLDFQSNMTDEMKYISDSGIKMCWATVFYFQKTDRVKRLFTLINHIKDHWSFYRFRYQLLQNTYRNDFAFAIALHILNGHMKSDWPIQLPIKLFYITDRDKIVSYKDNTWQFKLQGDLDCKIKDINIHVMNKIGLMKVIKDE